VAELAIPCLRYHDAPAAIEWLCRAFGFARHLVVPGGPGQIAHAELALGRAMIMLGSAGKGAGPLDELMSTPRELAGRSTQIVYLVVDDPDAHYEKALAAGAKVITPIEDKRQGGRGYLCSDPEGNLWSVGSYDPFA